MRGAPFAQFNFNLVAIRGGNVNYNPRANRRPSLMNQQTVKFLFTLQPLRQLTDDNTYLLDRDHSVADGALVYESQTFRSKINYQFTRSISARVIVEYDSTLANPEETSLLRTKQVGTEALLHLAAASRNGNLHWLQQRYAESGPKPLLPAPQLAPAIPTTPRRRAHAAC